MTTCNSATVASTSMTSENASTYTCYNVGKPGYSSLSRTHNKGTGCSFGEVQSGSNCLTYSCPSGGGWSLSGTNCTRADCPPGEIRVGSECQNPCEAKADTTTSACTPFASVGIVCISGCEAGVVNAGNQFIVGGVKSTCGTFRYTGATCTATNAQPNDTPPDDPCPGRCSGQVNGVTVCHDCGTDDPRQDITTDTESTETRDANGNVTSSETKDTTTTTTTGGGRTTTESTTKSRDANGNVTGSETTETTKDEEPEEKTECEENPEMIGCKQLGNPEEGAAVGTQSIGVTSISPVFFSGAAAVCPAPIPLPFGAEMKLDLICDFAEAVRPLFIALAWLSAAFIVMGASRQNG